MAATEKRLYVFASLARSRAAAACLPVNST